MLLACHTVWHLWHVRQCCPKSVNIVNFDRMQKVYSSTPGIEPGIFRSVGGRLIHWAMRNEAQEDFVVWDARCLFSSIQTLATGIPYCATAAMLLVINHP